MTKPTDNSTVGGGYAYLQYLSIDVALGAVASGGMAVKLTAPTLPPLWWVILPLSVWVIYTADHLKDAYRLKEYAHTARHLFHHRHFEVLLRLSGLMLTIIGGMTLLFFPLSFLLFGGGMLLLCAIYFWGLHTQPDHPYLIKEFWVGFIYSLGIWGCPFIASTSFSWIIVLIFIQFLLLVWANLFLFSLYEQKSDRDDNQFSWTTKKGTSATRLLIKIFLIGYIALMGIILLSSPLTTAVIKVELSCTLIFLIHVAIYRYPAWFSTSERYRLWGDAAFLCPFWIWL